GPGGGVLELRHLADAGAVRGGTVAALAAPHPAAVRGHALVDGLPAGYVRGRGDLPGPGGRPADRRLDRSGRAVAGDGGVAAGVPVHAASPVHHRAAPAGSGPAQPAGHAADGRGWRGHRPGTMMEAPRPWSARDVT